MCARQTGVGSSSLQAPVTDPKCPPKFPSISMTPRLAAAQTRARQLQVRGGMIGSADRLGVNAAAETVFVGRDPASIQAISMDPREPTPKEASIPARQPSGTEEGSPARMLMNGETATTGRMRSQDLLKRNHRIIASTHGRAVSASASTGGRIGSI